MRIGIFGGTFDPPHIGHIHAVKAAQTALQLDRVIIVPAFISPVKTNRVVTPPQMRLQMCELSFPGFIISDFEILNEKISYTIETIKHFKAEYPADELFLIIGTDSFLIFDRWYQYNEILKNTDLIVVNRDNDNTEGILRMKNELSEYGDIHVVNVPPKVISSSEIRNNFTNYTEYLHKSTVDFVKSNNLYADPK
jgi:nicotinate-nucleotide adenylyltransferase